MKKIFLSFAAAALSLSLLVTACSNNETNKDAQSKAKTSKTTENLPNYRYVDVDTILSRYNLAKDYQEEMIRMQNNVQNAAKRHEGKIQNYAASMENKMRNNGYLSEASVNQDRQTLANMQNEAQRSVAAMQQQMLEADNKANKAVIDSIQNFIKEYNKKHKYDAIFIKASTLYINPDLDITDEIVEGLNARYNKVKK